MPNCLNIQKSLAWCQGTPELPGIKRRLYYIAKSEIVMWPTLPKDDLQGRPISATYQGSFVLKADQKWKFIDILPDKSGVTSEAQGEVPSQTQLNKLTAVHPAVGEEASAAAAYLNNSDNVFIIEDMKGKYRVVGSDMWATKTTVAQDLGQGATGTTSTTINAEASDVVPAPFYVGEIVTEEGTINEGMGRSMPNPNPNGGSGSNTGTGDSSQNGSTAGSGNYRLTLVSDDESLGSVTGSGTYAAGSRVSIQAVPASGANFERWSDGNTLKSRTVIVNSDMTLTAYFSPSSL